ncbi:hypothetical protein COOONC_26619 [Cooperia oncophora]
MTDEDSPIIDLYPVDFRIDLNGKKFAWQGVALLPFVDEDRLLKTLETVQHTLTEEEKARNTTGPDRIFIGRNHPAFDFFKELYSNNNGGENSVDIDPAFTYGISGRITADKTALAPDLPFPSPVNDKSCPDLPVNGALMVIYQDPQYPKGFIFPARRLENAKEIPRTLRDYGRTGSDYRPQIGFTRDVPGRASLDNSAHRFIQHNARSDNRSYEGDRNNGGGPGRGYDGGRGGYQGGGFNRGGLRCRPEWSVRQWRISSVTVAHKQGVILILGMVTKRLEEDTGEISLEDEVADTPARVGSVHHGVNFGVCCYDNYRFCWHLVYFLLCIVITSSRMT